MKIALQFAGNVLEEKFRKRNRSYGIVKIIPPPLFWGYIFNISSLSENRDHLFFPSPPWQRLIEWSLNIKYKIEDGVFFTKQKSAEIQLIRWRPLKPGSSFQQQDVTEKLLP
ncbi:hypothetical protein Avbf_13966 [Armadillidium vulgare]|nr:hypothetical protein Avbf_13966 [Armadillidium vulgare]